MYNKKQNEKPLFAEVKPCDDEVRQQATNKDYKQRDQRIPYIKLTYPNVLHSIYLLPSTLIW